MPDRSTPPDRAALAPWLMIVTALAGISLFAATHRPIDEPPEGPPGIDKLKHFAAYALLAGLVYASRGAAAGRVTLRAALVILASLALYGAADELTQPLAGRICDPLDWLADLAGILLGMTLTHLLLQRCGA